MIREVDRSHYSQVVHDNNMTAILMFIFCILSCFLQWEKRLKITFIWKSPTENLEESLRN